MTEQLAGQAQEGADKRLAIVKLYLKDFSFESPQAPGVFQAGKWAPQTDLNLRSTHKKIDDKLHEVLLTVTVEAKEKDTDKTLFLVELHQAGIFEITGYTEQEMGVLVGSLCPNILFPYVRETVASIVQKGGFPEFILQPINFEALYVQGLQQQQQQAAAQNPGAASQETH